MIEGRNGDKLIREWRNENVDTEHKSAKGDR
jgi:hypothetical protein